MTLRSGPLAVRNALSQILSELGLLGLPDDDLGKIEIVLAEALNNVVEHAYPSTGPGGHIDIDCRIHTNGLHVRIVDHGRAMPGGDLPRGKPVDVARDLPDLPEGGFGWSMILRLAEDVCYSRRDDRNILNLRLALSQPV